MAKETFWCKYLIGNPLGFVGEAGGGRRRGGRWGELDKREKQTKKIEYIENENIFSN